MNKENWVPFYRADPSKKAVAFQGINETSIVILKKLSEHFRFANSREAACFGLAAGDVVKTCPTGFTVERVSIEFPFTDLDSQRRFYPSLSLSFIGCKSHLEKSISQLISCAEEERPAMASSDLWAGDIAPAVLNYDRREIMLRNSGNFPVGFVDKRNSVFIVRDDIDQAHIASVFPIPKV